MLVDVGELTLRTRVRLSPSPSLETAHQLVGGFSYQNTEQDSADLTDAIQWIRASEVSVMIRLLLKVDNIHR